MEAAWESVVADAVAAEREATRPVFELGAGGNDLDVLLAALRSAVRSAKDA